MISKRIIVDTLHGQIGCVFLGTSDVHKYISYEVTNLTKRFTRLRPYYGNVYVTL
jgi:hypothetical protein